jgi:protein-disulfide isomerase-like protein with CxxC motif
MSELKSAWEVAQERANRLGKLSAEEKERQEREGYRQIGQALAQKWMDGSQRLDIAAELGKHEEKGREIMKKAVIERLAEAIELTTTQNINSVKRAVEAIISLKPELRPRAEEMGQLLQEYELAEQKTRQEQEGNYRETLHRLRISGTAVDSINIEDNDEWRLARQGLAESLTPRLNALKQALVS